MTNRTFIVGVGMTKFAKPGTKEGDYPDWAREAGAAGARGRRDRVRAGRAGVRRLLLRRLDLRPARDLRPRPHGHPGRQRQQQLLDRFERAVPRPPGGQGRARRVRAGARLREDGARLTRRPSTPTARTRWTATSGADRAAPLGGGPAGPQMFGGPGASTWSSYGSSPSTSRGSAGRTTTTRSTTPTRSSRPTTPSRRSRTRADLRPADEAPVLADLRRQRRRDRSLRALRRGARPVGAGDRARRPVDGRPT